MTMTDNQGTVQPPDDQTTPPDEAAPPPPQREPVAFLDRAIAFILIIGPFSYLVAWLQQEFADMISIRTHNMIMLAAIIVFLIVVAYASRGIHKIRKKRMG